MDCLYTIFNSRRRIECCCGWSAKFRSPKEAMKKFRSHKQENDLLNVRLNSGNFKVYG